MKDLLNLKDRLDRVIQSRSEEELGRRKNRRAAVKTPAMLDIEREKEFFHQTHKITILNLSVNGLCFTTSATVIENDVLSVTFRMPTSGEKKYIDCQALRVKETRKSNGIEYQVGAKAVGREVVHQYRDMLKRRGQ